MTGASFVACQALLHPIGTEQFSQLPIIEQKVVTRSPKSNSHAQNVSPLRIIGVFLQRISYFIKNRMIIMIFSLSLDILLSYLFQVRLHASTLSPRPSYNHRP